MLQTCPGAAYPLRTETLKLCPQIHSLLPWTDPSSTLLHTTSLPGPLDLPLSLSHDAQGEMSHHISVRPEKWVQDAWVDKQ